MKRVATPSKPPVVVPVVVVTIDVHLALVVEVVERGEMYIMSSVPPPLIYRVANLRLYLIRYQNTITLCTK